MALPQYKVLRPTFIEPEHVEAGSIIATDMTPGDHLHPLNDEAREAMEAWYRTPLPVIDPQTQLPSEDKVWYPYESFRPVEQRANPPKAPIVEKLADPPRQTPDALAGLAGAAFRPAKEWTRPAPDPNAVRDGEAISQEPVEAGVEGTTLILQSAPRPRVGKQ